MTHRTLALETPPWPAAAVFDRILVAVDGTTAGFDACRQAARLATADSVLEAATVVHLAPRRDGNGEGAARERLTAAKQILGPRSGAQRLYGLAVDQLLAEAERLPATLLAIGAPERRRIKESPLGRVAGELLHRARCSVLVARPAPDLAGFPHRVVAGLDGTEAAALAFEVAQLLAGRHHGTLQGLVSYGDNGVAVDEIARANPRIETSERTPVSALVEASTCADLVVVGTQGRRARARDSVSERVAHQAHSSVLVIRTGKEE